MIFVLDLDGTIIDSSQRHWFLLKALLKKNNIPIPANIEQDYIEFKRKGNSTKKYLNLLGLSDELASSISKEWIENIENSKLTSIDVLYEDSMVFLEKLYEKYHKIFYLSNRKSKNNLLDTLNNLNIIKFAYDIIVTAPESGYKQKLDFLHNLKEQSNENIVMIGDTEVDYKAACEADIYYYLLNRGFRNREFWNSYNVKSYDSLIDIWEELI